MTTFFAKTFGGYSYGDNVATLETQLTFRTQTSTPPGKGGRYSSGALFDVLYLTLAGMIVAADTTDPASLRSACDAFLAAHIPGVGRMLAIDDDRYCNAEVSSDIKFDAWGGLPWKQYSLTLAAYDDPPWFSAATTTAALANGANTVTTAGTGPADPVVTFVVSAGGSPVTVTDGDGNVFGFTPDAAGTFIADTFQETLTAGGADKTALLSLPGQFLRLKAGANTWTRAGSNITSASVTWQDRWY